MCTVVLEVSGSRMMPLFVADGDSPVIDVLHSELKLLADSLVSLQVELRGIREDGRLQGDYTDGQLELIRTISSSADAETSAAAMSMQAAATRLQRETSACRFSQRMLQHTPAVGAVPLHGRARSSSATVTFLSGLAMELPVPSSSCVAALRQSLEEAQPPAPGTLYRLVAGATVLQDEQILLEEDLARITVVAQDIPKDVVGELASSELPFECYAGSQLSLLVRWISIKNRQT